MELDSDRLRERYRIRLREQINEWSRDRAGFSRNLMEPLVVSRAEQEGLLLILFEYAQEAARSWFESSARYYKRADFALEMFVYEVQTLWDKATSNLRFENTGALPFGWECHRCDLLLHAEDNGKSYRDALNKAIERQIALRFASVADELIGTEEAKVSPAAQPQRPEASSEAEEAEIIKQFLTGDPEKVASMSRGLARDIWLAKTTKGSVAEREEGPVVPDAEQLHNKRGRPADPKRHLRIVAIVTPYGDQWVNKLAEITGEFDAECIKPRKTANWKETWQATLAVNREVVKKAIQDSLNFAEKYPRILR